MRLHTTLAAVLATFGLAKALFVPDGTPDGVYDLTENEDGDMVLHKLSDLLDLPLIGDLESRDVSSTSHLEKRDTYRCYPITLIRNDIQRAAANLGNTCDSGVRINTQSSQVAVAGEVVVYACNTARRTRKTCSSYDLNNAVAFIENHCEVNRGGQLNYQYGSARSSKYGYTAVRASICN